MSTTPPLVNPQITEEVTQTDVPVTQESPAEAMSNLLQEEAEQTGNIIKEQED